MKGRELQNLGIPAGEAVKLAQTLTGRAANAGLKRDEMRETLQALVAEPSAYQNDPHFGELAQLLSAPHDRIFLERKEPAPWKQWGKDLEEGAVEQMKNACRLPVAVAGALMPDAHQGYGLPIGGVLATENAVIPYAVGVDIACRMKLTIFDLPGSVIEDEDERLSKILERETRFGIGASFRTPQEHEVMEMDWAVTKTTKEMKGKAHAQLGTSGSGNHFVEFGTMTLTEEHLGVPPGEYLAVLSHSGSRGAGARVADHYSKLAMHLHPELPKELRHLAWLAMDTAEGQEYWAAMQLMGHYAAANHAVIHRLIARAVNAPLLAQVENHHNFCWLEKHDGKEVYVHRKGATPAGPGVLGIIPGSMASPGYLVRGRGESSSLESASHGAGRVMSRTKAFQNLKWNDAKTLFEKKKVKVLSAGIDELPFVYKDIHEVMNAQSDLVDILGRFDPRIVKMAPAGEQPED